MMGMSWDNTIRLLFGGGDAAGLLWQGVGAGGGDVKVFTL